MEVIPWILIGAAILYLFYANSAGQADSSDSSSGSGTSTTQMSTLLSAIAAQENVSPSHNNPGAICGSYDANGQCLGPKTFATLDEGIAAAEANITRLLNKNPGQTLQQFISTWTGESSGAAFNNYVNGVSAATGIAPDQPVSVSDNDGDDWSGTTDTSDLSDEGIEDA